MKNTLKRRSLLIGLMTIVAMLLLGIFSVDASFGASAAANDENQQVTTNSGFYHGQEYSFDNIRPFLDFVIESGFDMDDDEAFKALFEDPFVFKTI